MVTEVQFSDEVMASIGATLPIATDPARLAALPELLRAWAAEDLREHLSWEDRTKVQWREKQLRALGAKAKDFIDTYAALDRRAVFDTAIEPQMLRDRTSPLQADVTAARRRRDCAIRWLGELVVCFNIPKNDRKNRQPPDKLVRGYLIVRDLGAIYEMVGEEAATRRVDYNSGKDYGPFSDFVEKIWMQIFNDRRGASYAIRMWADEMARQRNAINAEIKKATSELSRPLDDKEQEAIASRFRETSTFAANLSLKHPDLWRKLRVIAR
jgi:hypothetical protein